MIHGLLDQMQPLVSDDEEDERAPLAFLFEDCESETATTPAREDIRILVICGGDAAAAFADVAFSLRPVPWSVRLDPGADAPMFPPPPSAPKISVLAESGAVPAAFVLMKGIVPSNMAFAWTQALLDGFKSVTEVIFMDRMFRSAFRVQPGQDRPCEPHLGGLWSSAWEKAGLSESGAVVPLPVPNAVEGVAAALLTQCEVDRRCCLVARALQDGAHLTEGCLCAFEWLRPIFLQLGLVEDGWSAPNYSDAVRKVVPPPSMSIYA